MLSKERGALADGLGAALALGGVVAFFLVMYRTAWLCDDAYISYRVAENFVNGDGLRWNVVERVQPYTHPLWLFLNIIAFAITREGYLTFLGVSMITSLCAVSVVAFGLARNWGGAVLAMGLLIFSRAFMDYSTSGLENPLAFLLLGLFCMVFFKRQWNFRALFLMSALAGLAMLNRMDTILFFAPALGWAWLTLRGVKATLVVIAGFLPFIVWELFSILYYGVPVPNTAYAKLGTGISDTELMAQGLNYLWHTMERDPSTFVFLLIGLAVPFLARDWKTILLSLGGLLYLAYVVKIGGDFMGGRFLALPFLLAVIVISRLEMPVFHPRTYVILAIAVLISLSRPFSPPTTDEHLGLPGVYDFNLPGISEDAPFEQRIQRLAFGLDAYWNPEAAIKVGGFKDEHGIGDERRFWYRNTGLLRWEEGKEMPQHKYAQTGRDYRKNGTVGPKVHGSVGFRGFFGGPTIHIIDSYALADPLLARLPARYNPNWRIGHFTRLVPTGYSASVLGEETRLHDRDLAEYYDKLKLIQRGPLFDSERLAAIWALNTGQYDHLIDEDDYRYAGMRRMSIAEFREDKPTGTPFNDPGIIKMNGRGVEVKLNDVVHNSAIEISLDNRDTYRVMWLRNGEILGERDQTVMPTRGGLVATTYIAPLKAVREGYDTIKIFPIEGDKNYALGHVKLLASEPVIRK